jgi:hypothetical protein
VPESGRGGRAAGVEEGLQVGHLVLCKKGQKHVRLSIRQV